MYHFPSTLVLLKYQDPFIEYTIFEAFLSCSFLVLCPEFQHYSMNSEFQYHSLFKQVLYLELQVYSYRLNIGQERLNIAVTMQVLTKYWQVTVKFL